MVFASLGTDHKVLDHGWVWLCVDLQIKKQIQHFLQQDLKPQSVSFSISETISDQIPDLSTVEKKKPLY